MANHIFLFVLPIDYQIIYIKEFFKKFDIVKYKLIETPMNPIPSLGKYESKLQGRLEGIQRCDEYSSLSHNLKL